MASLRSLLLLDRTVGLAAAFGLNAAARLLGKLLRRDHLLREPPREVVVAKYLGLGSIVLTGRLCRAIKGRFPETRLTYLTTRPSVPLAERLVGVDRVLAVDHSGLARMFLSTLGVLGRLWRDQPEVFLDLEVYSAWSSVVATLSCARNRHGFYLQSTGFRRGLHTHLVYFNLSRHIGRIYREIAHSVGAVYPPDQKPLIEVRQEDGKACRRVLQESGEHLDVPYVLINVNASPLCLERRWPLERWRAFLAAAASRWSSVRFYLVGAPNEEDYVGRLHEMLGTEACHNVRDLSGRFSLPAYVGLVANCQGMVTVDSGPLHIAVALKRPTLSLWGPGSPEHYAPRGAMHRVLYRPPYCSPCIHRVDVPPCGGDNACMKAISVSSVLDAFDKVMRRVTLAHRCAGPVGRAGA